MLNPFLAPLTPPRPARTRNTLALLPPTTSQFPVFQTPSTPRKNTGTGQLATPSTGTRHKNNSSGLRTPQTSRKGALFSSRDSLLPPTPDFTPQRSPRSHRKKKTAVEDILRTPSQSTTDVTSQSPLRASEFSFGLFLPAPSTVGTGRKISTAPLKALRTGQILNFSTLAKLNENLQFEEDDDDKPLLHDWKSSQPLEESKSVMHLCTPRGQLIDDEKVNHWHGKSFNGKFDSDDDSEGELIVPQAEAVNPFISIGESSLKQHSRTPINPFASPTPPSKIDYSTHVEYVNNRTGERHIVKLLEKQSKIKPKRLNFANI